jgi:hypothetical protein
MLLFFGPDIWCRLLENTGKTARASDPPEQFAGIIANRFPRRPSKPEPPLCATYGITLAARNPAVLGWLNKVRIFQNSMLCDFSIRERHDMT